jgi:hypothetical protein
VIEESPKEGRLAEKGEMEREGNEEKGHQWGIQPRTLNNGMFRGNKSLKENNIC